LSKVGGRVADRSEGEGKKGPPLKRSPPEEGGGALFSRMLGFCGRGKGKKSVGLVRIAAPLFARRKKRKSTRTANPAAENLGRRPGTRGGKKRPPLARPWLNVAGEKTRKRKAGLLFWRHRFAATLHESRGGGEGEGGSAFRKEG